MIGNDVSTMDHCDVYHVIGLAVGIKASGVAEVLEY